MNMTRPEIIDNPYLKPHPLSGPQDAADREIERLLTIIRLKYPQLYRHLMGIIRASADWNCGANAILEMQAKTKVRRKIEELIRKDEVVLYKVATFLNIQ